MAYVDKVIRIDKGDSPKMQDSYLLEIGEYPQNIYLLFDDQADLQRFAGELAIAVSEQAFIPAEKKGTE